MVQFVCLLCSTFSALTVDPRLVRCTYSIRDLLAMEFAGFGGVYTGPSCGILVSSWMKMIILKKETKA